MVRKPILESCEISFNSETPLINEANINGTAINLRALIKIVPKGLIQSSIKSAPQEKLVIMRAKTTPNAIPNNICQCNASFFIYVIYAFVVLLINKKSAITSAAIASTMGTALGTTQGS